MKILITGSNGFIGQNLIAELRNQEIGELYEFDKGTEKSLLEDYCERADFVFHLAGVNRPENEKEFMEGNYGFTSLLLETLIKYKNNCPVMLSSSIQAALDNPYGISKRAGEELLFDYGQKTGAKVLVYRFPNVFGKWCRPNYNSVVATFCNNIAYEKPIQINNPDVVMKLVYIDDVVAELITALKGEAHKNGNYCEVPTFYSVKLGEIANRIQSFKESRETLFTPDMSDAFTKKLYSTYLSYLPEDEFSYNLKMNIDNRGSFTGFLKSPERGQVSVNITKPGIVKGNHWHHTKNEKFLVISGEGVIRFRRLYTDHVIEYHVKGEELRAVDIPPGYTHHIENIGDDDLVTIMWANEVFNPEKPDTFFLEV